VSSSTLAVRSSDNSGASTFWFGDLPVRAEVIDGEPWFVASDVANVLGYSSPANAVARHVDDADKGVTETMTPGGMQHMSIINESGLYSLIFGSKLAAAKAFQRWVTSEVLPSIRKTGQYGRPQALTRRELAQMVIEAEDRAASAELERDAAWQTVERNAPKVNYVERFVNPTAAAAHLGTFAAELGVPVSKLRTYLHQKKLIFRDKATESWRFYSSDRGRAWFEVRAHHDVAHRGPNGQVPTTLYVTPVGKEGVRQMLERDPGDVYG
jgi:anti-repressor protein